MPTPTAPGPRRTAIATLISVLMFLMAGCAQPGETEKFGQSSPTLSMPAQGSGQPSSDTTVIRYVSPISRDGEIQPGWRQAGETHSLEDNCNRSPVAVEDGIYQCGPSALAAMACFYNHPTEAYFCPLSPFGRQYRLLKIMGESDGTQFTQPYPWGLELDDGRECTIRQGGAWGTRDDGYFGTYSCDTGEEFVLSTGGQHDALFTVDPNGKWTVSLGELGAVGEQFPPPSTMGLAAIYYAAWAK